MYRIKYSVVFNFNIVSLSWYNFVIIIFTPIPSVQSFAQQLLFILPVFPVPSRQLLPTFVRLWCLLAFLLIKRNFA